MEIAVQKNLESDTSEQRHLHECRYWLKVTGGNKAQVDDLIDRIEKRRGKAAAQRLREGMREEFLRQREG